MFKKRVHARKTRMPWASRSNCILLGKCFDHGYLFCVLLTPICNLRRIRVRLVQLISIIQQRTSPPYAHYINLSDVFVLMKIVFEK